MATHVERINRVLRHMWTRRTAPLLRELGVKKHGPAPGFSKAYREREINQLRSIVAQSMRKRLKAWVTNDTFHKTVLLKGVVGTDKWSVVRDSLTRYQKRRNLVYVFWRNSKCLKVGRSEIGLNRIKNQKGSALFQKCNRVTVFFPSDNRKQCIPAFECALTHLYHPPAPIKPAKRKWREKCTLCKANIRIKMQVRKLFPL